MSDSASQQTKILVVDDEQIVLSIVRDALEEDNYRVLTASRAAEALEVIQSEQPDLIISDIRMPDMNGIELVKKGRSLRPGIGVVFMTGYANLNSAKDAIKQGALDYIMKPFELDEIRAAVNKAAQKMRKEASDTDPDRQLEQLSDFNRELVSVGDRGELCAVSTRFAMMMCNSEFGMVIFWNWDRSHFTRLTMVNQEIIEDELPADVMTRGLTQIDPDMFREPNFLTAVTDHPFYRTHQEPQVGDALTPSWFRDELQLLVVPVLRSSRLLAIICVGCPGDSSLISAADLKTLRMSAGQLALALENLDLLEETRAAYTRLQELQDETIQLEKTAGRGKLSAEIGHELRNFLGIVTGAVTLLDQQAQAGKHDQLAKYIQAITDNLEKITAFTGNLLDLTPISGSREVLQFEQLLGEVVTYLKPQRRFQDLTITIESSDRATYFEADRVQIQQLLYNLFNNAADATAGCDRREITVRIDFGTDGSTFSVTITDTGTGIEDHLLDRLFREHVTAKESGHGIGLMVCRRIVDSHNGQIRIDSTPGVGTTVRIDFPLANVTTPTTETAVT